MLSEEELMETYKKDLKRLKTLGENATPYMRGYCTGLEKALGLSPEEIVKIYSEL